MVETYSAMAPIPNAEGTETAEALEKEAAEAAGAGVGTPARLSPVRKQGAAALSIAGLVPFSTVDWPGQLVASVFAQGCPFRCPYCHNHEILNPRSPGQVEWEEVTDLLKRRQGLLDGLVFSGGEAMMQAAPPRRFQGPSRPTAVDSPLGRAMAEVKELGFKTGLHAAGSYPKWLDQLLDAGLVDWVGLDVKAMPGQYEYVTGSPVADEKVEQSLAALVQHANEGNVDYEVRLTLWPGLLRAPGTTFSADIIDPKAAGRMLLDYGIQVAQWSHDRGARKFALQRFQTQTVQDKAKGDNIPQATWDDEEATFMLQQVGFDWVQVR